ncbi:MAG TPA: hypothetical protein VGR07_08670 [Thermoanaerobaculia bacterium]|jgi:tetratricopeptide (TPR) repeat protein|nr:hypothetical protein [Thermoanaerobaculia bacterium]
MNIASEKGNAAAGALCERLARTHQCLKRERAGAPELLAELLAGPAASQPCRIAVDPRFQTWGLAELLLARGQALLAAPADDATPTEAGRLARLTLAVAGLLVEHHPAPLVQDLRARAWANLGEAGLASGDLAGAVDALRSAAACLGHGTGDLLVDARLLEFEAAVRAAQGRPGDALALLKQAAARYRRVNEPVHLARVLARREELQGKAREPGAVPHLAFEPAG